MRMLQSKTSKGNQKLRSLITLPTKEVHSSTYPKIYIYPLGGWLPASHFVLFDWHMDDQLKAAPSIVSQISFFFSNHLFRTQQLMGFLVQSSELANLGLELWLPMKDLTHET